MFRHLKAVRRRKMERVRKVLVGFSEVIEVILAIGVAVLLVMDIIGLLPKIGA